MGKNISNLVRVTAAISPQGLLRREFGIGLFITTDDTLGVAGDRVGVYADIDSVLEEYGENSEVYKAATAWFAQIPLPKNFVAGRWIKDASDAFLFGGTSIGALAAFQAISDGSFQMNTEDMLAIDLSAVTSLADVATALQAALQAAVHVNLTDATVTYDVANGRFIIDNVVSGSTSTLTFAGVAASGTDLSTLVGWDSAGGGTLRDGADAETITQAIEAIRDLNASWYYMTIEATLGVDEDQAILDIASWASTRPYFFFAEKDDIAILATGETTSVFAQLLALEYDRVTGDFASTTGRYLAVSSAARMSSWNPAQAASLPNPAYKDRPGFAAVDLTTTQITELESKEVNYYAEVATQAGDDTDSGYFFGTTFKDGVFQDVRVFVDWLVNAVQTDVYNLLKQSTRVPQTNSGQTSIQRVIEAICEQGILNGGIAPGQLSEALRADIAQSTGNADFDGFLTKGYLVFWPALSMQSQSDRNQRKASPFKVWVKGSGAINTVEIAITFEN